MKLFEGFSYFEKKKKIQESTLKSFKYMALGKNL